MALDKAKTFLEKTMWYEMAELAKIQPTPKCVRKKREEALVILKKEGNDR